MALVWQMYRLLVNLPTFSSCFNNFIKLFIKIYETSVEYICCEIISTDDIANGEATRSGPSPAVDHWCPPHTFKIYAPISYMAPGCCIHPIFYLKNVLPS